MTLHFVPPGFDVPLRYEAGDFLLEPLGPEHNEADYDAWTSSIDHIRATPGFAGRRWPDPSLSLDENRRDLVMHASHFRDREGFTYTVRERLTGDIIGCLYIYPRAGAPGEADVRSWVRATEAARDVELYRVVRAWLESDWPFASIHYDAR